MTPTLFDKYGGFATFHKISGAFDQRLLNSASLSHYFGGMNLERLVLHQAEFISAALGSTSFSLNAEKLHRTHQLLDIPAEHFEEALEHLAITLEEFSVDAEDRKEILDIIRRYEPLIVNQKR